MSHAHSQKDKYPVWKWYGDSRKSVTIKIYGFMMGLSNIKISDQGVNE